MLVFDLTDQVRETIQQTLYALLMQRARSGVQPGPELRGAGSGAVLLMPPTAPSRESATWLPTCPTASRRLLRGVRDRRADVGVLVTVGEPVGQVLHRVLHVVGREGGGGGTPVRVGVGDAGRRQVVTGDVG